MTTFPDSLLSDRPEHAAHNRAVFAYKNGRDDNGRHRQERALLGFLAGVDELVACFEWDPFAGEQLHETIRGFEPLLSYERGRLDGGTVSTWLADAQRRAGVNPDTGEWLGD